MKGYEEIDDASHFDDYNTRIQKLQYTGRGTVYVRLAIQAKEPSFALSWSLSCERS
jgi:hypothetical protein